MRYLLLAGSNYYPYAYTGNWIGLFETEAEAYSFYSERKDQYQYNWYEIVDLHNVERYINK